MWLWLASSYPRGHQLHRNFRTATLARSLTCGTAKSHQWPPSPVERTGSVSMTITAVSLFARACFTCPSSSANDAAFDAMAPRLAACCTKSIAGRGQRRWAACFNARDGSQRATGRAAASFSRHCAGSNGAVNGARSACDGNHCETNASGKGARHQRRPQLRLASFRRTRGDDNSQNCQPLLGASRPYPCPIRNASDRLRHRAVLMAPLSRILCHCRFIRIRIFLIELLTQAAR